jgi:hypothetical protein
MCGVLAAEAIEVAASDYSISVQKETEQALL